MIVKGCDKFPDHKKLLKEMGKTLDLKKIIFKIDGYNEVYHLITKTDDIIELKANSTILSKGYLDVNINKI